ncbi:MAG: hypothetical protein WBE72_15335 [Terracidiphilus sp.]
MPEHENRGLEPGAEFDLLLRSSLQTYADPGPESDLAQRVLARVAAEGERGHTQRMIRWAVALPLAACLIAVIALLASKPLHRPADRANQARVTPPGSTDAGRRTLIANSPSVMAWRNDVARSPRHPSRAAAAPSVQRLPKLDVFPAPQPLTPPEQALIAYVAHAPQAERQSLIETEQKINAPLSIEALEIKPLEPPEPGGN